MSAPYYSVIYHQLINVAKRHGYACAIHGTLNRDVDILFVPWTDDAEPQEILLDAIRKFIGGPHKKHKFVPTIKPHGRRAYSVHLNGHQYLDISIMPRLEYAEL